MFFFHLSGSFVFLEESFQYGLWGAYKVPPPSPHYLWVGKIAYVNREIMLFEKEKYLNGSYLELDPVSKGSNSAPVLLRGWIWFWIWSVSDQIQIRKPVL